MITKKHVRRSQRSHFEQIIDLLQTVRKHPTYVIYRIVLKSGINYSKAYSMLEQLSEKGFITLIPKERAYGNAQLTEKGWKWLQEITKLIKMVEEEILVY